MPLPSDVRDETLTEPQPSRAATPTRPLAPGVAWLRFLAAAAIGLMLALSSGLLMVQRDAAMDLARAQAGREVLRLAAEIEQSLRVAQASLRSTGDTAVQMNDLPPERLPSLANMLSLPFSLERLPPETSVDHRFPAAQWQPELARQQDGQWVLPMRWRQPEVDGGPIYELTFPREALLSRFASEGLPVGGSMSLFRLEPDGATTVLVRHPLVPQEQGLTMRGHVAHAVSQAASGVFDARSQIDGVQRIVGFRRLSGGADRLVIVYALSTQSVLASWYAVLPWATALTLVVAAAMTYGAWRLDRSVRALARSERHFQTLSDHLPDVFVRYDVKHRVLYANPAVEAATGMPAATMVGRTLDEYGAPPDVTARWRACLQRVFDTGQPETLSYSHTGPTGERHWEAHASLEPVTPGEPPTALVIARDITERHETESRQRSAQQLFETVFFAAPEAMSLSHWTTGELLLVNDAFCALFDRPGDQLIGHSAVDMGLWQPASVRQQIVQSLQRGEPVRDVQASSTRPDGKPIHVRISAERVQVDGQDRLLLMFRDVTQLESDQRALARSELRFRLAATHGQVWEWDFGQGFLQPSDEFFVALGHPPPPADEMGPRFLDLLHPEDREGLRQVLRRFFKGEGEYRLEFRARDAQGRYHWFDTRGDGLRDASGRVTYMAGTTFDISDRKALEEAQRQTLKHLDTVANASSALAWTVDAHQHPDWINQAWLDYTGRDLVAECEAFWLDDLHPQDRARCERIFNESFSARQPYSMEYRLRRHDGQYRWLHEQGKPRHDADGQFIGYVGSCLDVTDLREAETSARERGTMLKQVFDVLKDMLFVVDAQECFVFFQAGSEDRLYRKPEDFLGRPMAEVMPPALVPPLRSAMARAREAGLQELDYSLDLPVGTHHFNARLAWLPDGQQCMFLVRDITEQQNAQRERERLSRFVLLLFRLASRFINLPVQQMDQGIDDALADMGGFVSADRAYLFVYDHASRQASNTHEWCAPGVEPQKHLWQQSPIDRLDDWYRMHLRGERVQVVDVLALPANALRERLEPMGIRSLLTLPLMDGERCLGFVGLDSVQRSREYGDEDITLLELFAQMLVNLHLRAEAVAQVHEMTERLEQKVEERTQQLNESVQRLQTVNRELESFTYSASHDLRTPLRGIEGFCTLLLEEHAMQLDEQGREYLRRIQRATRHMAQLVSDLLAYARVQQLTEHVEPVAIASCARTVLLPFQDELAARLGQVDVDVPETLCVRADPQGLAIVLRNLIDNALKFTPTHEAPQVRIAAQVDGPVVRLTVSDRGMGFDMQHHDRIFGMFQRLHRQDQIPGTGIGLALVHKAVERMGGQIRADSAPGQGATFHLDLPAA